MATDAQSTAPPDRRPAEDRGETLVQQRIASARRQLRLVDLASGLALLAICLLGYFLLLALVEHWLLPLGTAARYLAWGALLLGGGYFLIGRLLPAIIRPINPIFAAKTIEQGDASLKNSLINFLLFRHRRTDVLPVVYQALQQQAAAGVARVSPDTMVDRSGLIKLGYVLAASLALFAVYEIGSPKDALQTAQRVLLPWADIAVPTRVTISEVTPADARAYRGFPVEVAAEVRGLRDEEPVTLLYSTADGQIVDRPIVLTRESSTGHRFTGTLPESGGVMQNLHYRIAAGDCVTPEYTITALDEPMAVITRVEYHPPKYTGRESRVEEGGGDLKALEQTLVTLHAEANYPLASGTIEFDPDRTDKPRSRPLEVAGSSASVSFRLELDSERKTARHRTYQLRIVTEDQARNAQPILHTIEVVADLAPEVKLLAPVDRLVELPQDGRLPIEVRAIDPDFGLSALHLRANQGGQSLLEEALLGEGEQPRQHRGEYQFEPARLGLPVGAEVVYWAEAADNRTAQPEGSPAPNRAKTEQYRIRITPPAKPPQQQPGEGEGNPEQSPDAKQDPSGNPDANNSAENQGEQPGEGEQGGAEGESGAGAEGEGAEGESQAGAEQQGEGAGGESQQEGELGEGSGDERTGQGSNPNGPEGADQEGAGGNQSLGEGGTKAGDQTGGNMGESGGTEPGAGSQPSGNAGEAGQQNETPQQGGGGENSRPLDAEGAEDAEAFQRAQEFFEEQQRKQEQAAGSASGTGEQSPQANSDSANAHPQDNSTAEQGTEGEPQDSNTGGGGTNKPGEGQEATGENPGGRPQGADDRRPEEGAGTGEQEQNPQRNGGQGTTGESGAGKPGDPDSQGAPEAQGTNRDKPKDRTDSGQGDKPNEEAQSPSVSKQQSDSEGEKGDRSGGGGEGGGQGAKQPGNDSPGSTTAADEGAGAANEPGAGETGDGPGSEQTAEGQTGQSGEQPGNGSRNQPGEEGAQPGEGQTNNQQPGEASDQPGDPNNTGGESQPSPAGDTPGQGGAGAPGRPPSADREFADDAVPPADEVNLDYARQATDLVLDKLEQQAEQPNQELLDRLGWTPEQLQQFVSRWQAMKEKSQQPGDQGEAARRELDEALQSLGLVPEASRQIEARQDSVGGARDAGFRSQPPAEYQRLYDAFRKSGG